MGIESPTQRQEIAGQLIGVDKVGDFLKETWRSKGEVLGGSSQDGCK